MSSNPESRCRYFNLLSVTKPTKCTYNIHSSIIFYHSLKMAQ